MTAFDKFKKLVEHVKQDHGSEALEALEWDEFAGAVVELEPSITSELSALQKENAELRKETPTADAIIWRRACNLATDELETLRTQNREFREMCKVKDEALQSVIDSCVHPDVAIRAVMVTLEPIRKALALQPEK